MLQSSVPMNIHKVFLKLQVLIQCEHVMNMEGYCVIIICYIMYVCILHNSSVISH